MGQILHGGAKTTHVVRAAIQRSKASIKELAGRYDLNPKRVTKWKKCAFNGQVERMNRTFKEATVRRYHYDSHDQLRQHLAAFLDA